MGKALGSKSIMAAPFTGGVSLLGNGKVKDTLFGAKTPGTPDSVIDLADPLGRANQSEALSQYGDMLKNDYTQNQMDLQERQARVGADDQARKAEELVAQHGLGNSSVGLNALLNAHRDLGDRIGAIHASAPMLKQQNLQLATQGTNSILNEQGQSKIFKQGQQAQGRGGGLFNALAPVAGTAAGAFLGGPGGAAMGAKMFGGMGGSKGGGAGSSMALNYDPSSMAGMA